MNVNLELELKNIKKKYQTYGATTLNAEHILFKEDQMVISFIGKKVFLTPR